MTGTVLAGSVSLGTVATSWNIVGAADFNGDGQADILWQNSSGARAIWLMNGTVHTGSVNLGTVATSWNIVGSGDFNGDGQADILWQNSSGARAIWLMTGSYIDLERAILSNMTLPVLLRNAVMPGRQRDLEPTIIIGGEGRNGLLAFKNCSNL